MWSTPKEESSVQQPWWQGVLAECGWKDVSPHQPGGGLSGGAGQRLMTVRAGLGREPTQHLQLEATGSRAAHRQSILEEHPWPSRSLSEHHHQAVSLPSVQASRQWGRNCCGLGVSGLPSIFTALGQGESHHWTIQALTPSFSLPL